MYLLCDGVAFSECDLAVCADLNIHINLVAKYTSLDQVHAEHAGLF